MRTRRYGRALVVAALSLYVCDGCGVAVTHSLPHALIFERSHNGVTRGQRLELCVRCADHAEREIRTVLDSVRRLAA